MDIKDFTRYVDVGFEYFFEINPTRVSLLGGLIFEQLEEREEATPSNGSR